MMRFFAPRFIALSVASLFSVATMAQLPKLKIEKPKVNISVPSSGGGSTTKTGSDIGLGKKDPSGLFKNCTDDPSADFHRKDIVEKLHTLEAEMVKSTIDYDMLTKLMFEMDRTSGHINKLEPKVDRTEFDAKYNPLKARADKENAIYAEATKLEEAMQDDYAAESKMQSPDPLSFRAEGYYGHSACYCRDRAEDTKTYAEFVASKQKYMELVGQLKGYTNNETQTMFANMDACLKNGNAYAAWAANENYDKAIKAYAAEKQASNPQTVIKRCSEYLEALGRIESDFSLNLDAAAKSALADGKAKTSKVKADAETYLNGGGYQKYLDTEHAAEIAKVFMPKAGTKNATLEAGAIGYVKGTEYGEYIADYKIKVASTLRCVSVSPDYIVHKNEFGLPLYQYKEFAVAFKGADGKCYVAAIYANYTYKGGGTYATIADWGGDSPEEMACANVTK